MMSLHLYLTVFTALIVAIIATWTMRHREQDRLLGIAALMQAAAWTLIRHMENDPVGQPGKLARGREALITRIAIEGAEKLKLVAGAGVNSAAPMGMMMPPTPSSDPQLTQAAQDLLAKNEEGSAKFWFKANGIRTGNQVFLAIMAHRNMAMAWVLMTDHMKKQRDEWENNKTKRSPNFTELKMVLGLPTEWPVGDVPESFQKWGINERRAERIIFATNRYRDRIFTGILYKPYPREGDPAVTYEGEQLMEGMREYIR